MGKKISTREAYGNALAEYGSDERIVVLDADLSKSTKTDNFRQLYPERFFNMGIAESNMVTVAAGIATCGKVVFASSFAVFATGRAFEQIRNSICYPGLNVKIAASHSGLTVGEDGASHQSIEDISIMRSLPNMSVICPADAIEARLAIRAAIDIDGPFYIRLGRPDVPVIYDEDYKFEFGKGVQLREGNDITIIATGSMLRYSLEAAEQLENVGISARVVNIHTIKPIDEDIIVKAADETGAIVTVEEHSIIGGLGSAVAEVVTEKNPVPVKRVGVRDQFGKSGKPDELLKRYGLTADNIIEKVREAIEMKSKVNTPTT